MVLCSVCDGCDIRCCEGVYLLRVLTSITFLVEGEQKVGFWIVTVVTGKNLSSGRREVGAIRVLSRPDLISVLWMRVYHILRSKRVVLVRIGGWHGGVVPTVI